ncbi:MAG TPA: GAF domain-containing protein [Polyangiales bacterium]
MTRVRPRKRRTSEAPADLQAERQTFVRKFLRKGVEITEDLIRENQELQTQARKLEDENSRLRSQLASNDAMAELLAKIKQLERERKSLVTRSDKLERAFKQNEASVRTIERELNDLASLYVASFQLGGTLSLRRVVRHVCELLEQLVGAQEFVIYALSEDGRRALPIAFRRTGKKEPLAVSAEDGPIADACLTGVARIADPMTPVRKGEPLAVVPLVFDVEVVGVISIHTLLPHKSAWEPVDHELFKLLSAHGATALIAANLFEREGNVRAALRDLHQNLHGSERPPPPAVSNAKMGD